MVFTPPSWVPNTPLNIPDDIPISRFMLNEKYGRQPFKSSRNPFTCGITGKTYTIFEQAQRVEHLSRALSKELGWQPNTGTEWDKVMGVFSLNTIDFMTLAYAVHELGGLVSPANAQYSAAELEFQLKSSGAKALFTCIPLLETALQAAKGAGIKNDQIYILDMPKVITGDKKVPFKTADDLISAGEKLQKLEPLRMEKGQAARQTAYLCYSSGTSGLPKGVMISHQNVMSNVLQIKAFEQNYRDEWEKSTEVALGLLPLSHIYGLVVIAQGLTETSTVVCMNSGKDLWLGSCGSLLPGVRVKLVNPEGVEVTGLNKPGELVAQSKSVVLGYLNNEKANKETFLPDTDGNGRWMRTGDEAEIRLSPSGNEHVFIVDRIKELIKVKGLQVAPAELESHILAHPSVADCAVIPIPDDAAGEIPKAYVVKSTSVGIEENDLVVKKDIMKWVESHKARHKWLKGGVEFIDVIPKSPSGKILRRLLRDKEKEARRAKGAKL
ncbi:hypothetical protein SS1G_11459 [Sclerotinia sclerotiorum 1980 UF-70]|uniref:Uncharacterized protein n=1 Tax=Sclerotinia sclerotiorum (strain ATCC 18683 / 1980 / Ss-1) TaxID=665079 RepID=A7F1I9_SCLS1|nr:hypothetical protein SS1G_11459 [Sclerotinia sclerotiorum 1980 UF-70]EDN95581.1 hypothetical protein SS1G_11459 [Sclerotinia sclerotiorum 1980 UF-70]